MQDREALLQLFTKPNAKRNQKNPDYKPHPYRRPGPGGNETRTTQIDPDIKLRVFNFASKSLQDIDQVDWKDIQALAISDSGLSGVIFLQTEKGSITVKGSENVGLDQFLHYLAQILIVPVPNLRIVRYDSPEFKLLTKEFQRASFQYDELYQKIRTRLDRPFLEIIEYIPGISLAGMGPKRSQKIMNFYDPKGRHRLIRLGITYSFDILINNAQRLPLSIWNNTGDLEHLICRTEPSFTDTTKELRDPENLDFEYYLFYALDHKPMMFQEFDKEWLGQYFSSVEDFLNKLFLEMKSIMQAQLDPLYETKEQKIESLDLFKKLVLNQTLFEMKEMTVLQIMLGIVLGMDNIVYCGFERIEVLFDSVKIDPSDDYKNMWNDSLRKVNLYYLSSMVHIYRKFLSLHRDVVKWTKDITLNQYSFNYELYEEIIMRNPRIRKEMEEQKEREMKEKEDALMKEQQDEELSGQNEDEQQGDQNNENPNENNQNPNENNDEILEEELDDESLNRKIKDIFQLDLTELKSNLKSNKPSENQQTIQKQPTTENQQSQPQPQIQPKPQQQQQQGLLAKNIQSIPQQGQQQSQQQQQQQQNQQQLNQQTGQQSVQQSQIQQSQIQQSQVQQSQVQQNPQSTLQKSQVNQQALSQNQSQISQNKSVKK